jgi:hypothetical protein
MRLPCISRRPFSGAAGTCALPPMCVNCSLPKAAQNAKFHIYLTEINLHVRHIACDPKVRFVASTPWTLGRNTDEG